MEELRTSDWVGIILVGLLGLIPVLMTVFIAWWVMFGGRP